MILNIVKKVLLFIAVVSITGFLYEQYSRSTTYIQPVGELVDIGGYNLHYLKKGSGDTTVVFESGSDIGGHLPWFKVQNEVAKFATTISYDRAGLMWSQRGDKPRTGDAMAQELHLMLENSGAKKPYVLVGHSLAGLILRSFVNKYPDDVKSIILVDPSHPKQNMEYNNTTSQIPLWLVDYANSIGLFRLFVNQDYDSTLHNDEVNVVLRKMMYKGFNASMDEMNNFDNIALDADKLKSFGDIPVTIISANIDDDIWIRLHDELANMSTNSKHIKVKDAGHYIQLEKPKVVIDAIKERL